MKKNIGRCIVATVVAVYALAGTGGAARADDSPLNVFGYLMDSTATAFAWQYNQPSFGVPGTPTFELRFMNSSASNDSGPESHALSSVMWPGDIAGNAGLSLVFSSLLPSSVQDFTRPYTVPDPNGALDSGYTTIKGDAANQFASAPPYPVRAESQYPPTHNQPPVAHSAIAGGMDMDAATTSRMATATTTGSRMGFPPLFTASHMTTTVTNDIEDGLPTVTATTTIKDFRLGNEQAPGMDNKGGADGVDISAFVITEKLVSDGTKVSKTGSIQIEGLKLGGYPVVNSGPDGPVWYTSYPTGWDAIENFVNTEFAPQGVSFHFGELAPEGTGGAQSMHLTGLRIHMDAYAMAKYADRMPEPIRSVVRDPGNSVGAAVYDALPQETQGLYDSFTQFDQSMDFLFGDVVVGDAASPQFSFGVPSLPPVNLGGGALPPSNVLGTQYTQPPAPTSFGPGPTTIAASPVGVIGVEKGLTILAILLAIGVAVAMRRFAVVATCPPGSDAPGCTLNR